MQLRDAVERQERRIAELERNIETERYRREVAESVLEDPQLMHQLNVEIERLQSALSDRERELEDIAAAAEAGGASRRGRRARGERHGVDPEQLSELEGKIAVYEIELLELRARLEDVIDREFADLREGELKEEIERLGAALAAAGTRRAATSSWRRCARRWRPRRMRATRRRSARPPLAARVDALEAERESESALTGADRAAARRAGRRRRIPRSCWRRCAASWRRRRPSQEQAAARRRRWRASVRSARAS